jgi:DNA-binding transcriptional ArsR family regulator
MNATRSTKARAKTATGPGGFPSSPDRARPAPLHLTRESLVAAAHCLRTLAHPTRLRLVELLLGKEHTVGELAAACRVSSAVASTHLGLMKDRGFLRAERRGREVYYAVNEMAVAGIIECLRTRFGAVEPD